jgi:TetR/AcrR family transcriptional regulator, regulator of cefoperazone and chloramphenicol sensitivity
VRQLNEAAGQRNTSALHYHFGSREGLLRAIVERHQAIVDADRARRLAAIHTDPEADSDSDAGPALATAVELIVAPLAERLRSPSGRDYLRIVPQCIDRKLLPPPALDLAVDMVRAHIAHLPPGARSRRMRAMLLFVFTMLADRAATPDRAVPYDEFVGELCAMATAVLTVPLAAASG